MGAETLGNAHLQRTDRGISTAMKRETLLVLAILLAAVLIRLIIFRPDIGLTPSDIQRDYLVSSHILRYGESPLRGPDGYSENLLPASPLYYYLLVPLLWIHTSIAMLNGVNFVLQIVFLLIIYLLARSLFDRKTAVIALCLATFTPSFIDQAKVAWQPTIAQPILYGGYLLLYRAYMRNHPLSLFLGLTCVLCSLAIAPSSTVTILPMLGVVLFMMLRRTHKAYLPPLLGSVGIFFCLFILPFLLRVATHPDVASTWNTGILTNHAQTIISLETLGNIWQRAGVFTGIFKLPAWTLLPFFAVIILTKQRRLLFLAACILLALLFAAIIQTHGIAFPDRAFMPVAALALISVAHLLTTLHPGITATLIILPLLFFPPRPDPLLQHGGLPDVLQNDIERVRTQTARSDYHFFTLRVYVDGVEDPFAEIPVWIWLEEHLGTQLVVLDDSQLWEYRLPETGPRPYVFILCWNTDCMDAFRADYPTYQTVQRVTGEGQNFLYEAH